MVNTILNTDYDVFNYVKQHLLNQNEKSVDPHTLSCFYRAQNEDGKTLKCAVGCLIDDNFYSEKLENCSPNDLDVRKAVENSIFSDWEYNVSLLSELQNIHDEYESDEWSLKLEHFEGYFSPIGEYIQAG